MVKSVADANGKNIKLTKAFNLAITHIPVSVINKVFGNLTYDKVDLVDEYGIEESIRLTEEKG